MKGYDHFMLRMVAAGGSDARDENIENSRMLVNATFEDDPSFVKEGAPIWNSDRIIYPRIYEDTYRSTSPAQAQIMSRLEDPFYLGDVIYWPKHGYWLCIHSTNLHDIQYEGTLTFCNYMLKFRSPVDKQLVTYPVSTLNTTQYGTGEKDRYDGDVTMRIGVSQMIIYISYDEVTALIDSGFRFIIDRNYKQPSPFRVTQADTVSYSDGGDRGYIRLTVEEVQLNHVTDDVDEMVADLYDDDVGSAKELDYKTDLWL